MYAALSTLSLLLKNMKCGARSSHAASGTATATTAGEILRNGGLLRSGCRSSDTARVLNVLPELMALIIIKFARWKPQPAVRRR